MNRLSHSAASKFQECPTAYSFHYEKKLRAKYLSAALFFGSAIDVAVEAMLKGNNEKEAFDKKWAFQEVNKVEQYLPESTAIVYGNSDFDRDLITDAQKLKLPQDWQKKYEAVSQQKELMGWKNLKEEDKKYFNLLNWYSLQTKGHLMLDAFRKKILPKITKVLATQKEIKLTNATGDTIIGFADLVCEYADNGNDIVVFDVKTSARLYEEEAVLTSSQLSLYVHSLYPEYKTRKAGYFVLGKRVTKNKTKICTVCGHDGTGARHATCNSEATGARCGAPWKETIRPEINIQVLIDDIPVKTEDIVLENLDFINQSIKNGVFHRNLQSCMRDWGPCTYFNVCYKDDYSDVVDMSEK